MNYDETNELVNQFYSGRDAQDILHDIEEGDKILSSMETVQPDKEVLDAIKAEISGRLMRRSSRLRTIKIVLSAAACLVLLALAGIIYLNNDKIDYVNNTAEINTSKWNIDNDVELAELTEELESAIDDILDIPIDEYVENRDNVFDVLEKEIESVASNDNFWDE